MGTVRGAETPSRTELREQRCEEAYCRRCQGGRRRWAMGQGLGSRGYERLGELSMNLLHVEFAPFAPSGVVQRCPRVAALQLTCRG